MIDLETIEKEFTKFVDNYERTERVLLKEKHTKRVANFSCQIAKWFAEDEKNQKIISKAGSKEKFINLATTIGWLHDLGRFEQAKLYDSFSDRKTFDHAQKGVEILKNNNYIAKYCNEERLYDTIFTAIYNHNKLEIEEGLNEFDLVQSKIIRDADKLDILRVYVERLENFKKDDNNTKINPNILKDLQLKKQIRKEDKHVELDDYLLSLGFIFDINYKRSFELLKQLNYINIIIDKMNTNLTDNEIQELEKVRKILNDEIELKLRNS